MFKLINIFYVILLFLFFTDKVVAKEEEKDCQYCLKYEKILDWPVEDRPAQFVYQEDINYPKGMFGVESKMAAGRCKGRLPLCEKEKITWESAWSNDYGHGVF